MEFSPGQFGHLVGGDPGVKGKSMAALADTYYNREPEYMAGLESHVKENGFKTPVGVQFNDQKGNFSITSGHHRAAVAQKLQIPLPADDASDNPGANPDRVDASWSVGRNQAEGRTRNALGERGDNGYKTRMK